MLTPSCTLELQMINDVFTTDEILYAIRSLKNNKAPGIDGIPAEIIKYCQVELIDLITDIFNYIVENRNFGPRAFGLPSLNQDPGIVRIITGVLQFGVYLPNYLKRQ